MQHDTATPPDDNAPAGAQVALAACTTMRVGGTARAYCEVSCPDELACAVRRGDEAREPVFVLGDGSNVLVGDAGFDGLVVRTVGGGISVHDGDRPGKALVTADAGTAWDALVEFAVERGLAGIEALSGIPGQIGSAVMQNLGAYGQEVGSCLVGARLLDRATGEVRAYDALELGLGYRTSMLRASLEEAAATGGRWFPTPRWVVLDATLSLERSQTGAIAHEQLARALGCAVGGRMPIAGIRRAVLEVRAAKGMVVDPDPEGAEPLYDRWSSGSFFTNPVLSEEDAERMLPDGAPRYPGGAPGLVKTSAAWLIEHAGFAKGYGIDGPGSAATLSTLHTLALTNRGSARAADVLALARAVRDGVEARFGVRLVPESVLVGCKL